MRYNLLNKVVAALAISAFALPAQASPHIPGKKGGGINMGVPTPSPTPTPTPTPTASIIPGSTAPGSWATTPTPGSRGNSSEPLYQTSVIGAWDMVPYQGLTATDNQVCVVAFHAPTPTEYAGGTKNAIDYVEIAANGGAWDIITTPTTTNRTGKSEYCAPLDQSGLGNNVKVELRAILYPKTGKPLVLQGDDTYPFLTKYWSLNVVANYTLTRYYMSTTGSDAAACTSGAPCASLKGVRAQIGSGDYSNVEACFQAGSYNLTTNGDDVTRTANNGWFTVTTCPSVAKSAVTITGWGDANKGAYLNRLHLKGVMVNGPTMANIPDLSAMWVDNVSWDSGGSGAGCYNNSAALCQLINVNSNYDHGVFVTDSDFAYAHDAMENATLYRNVTIDHINSDGGQNVRFWFNVTETNVFPCCKAHPDTNQVSTKYGGQGHIIYGLTAVTHIDQQGLFSSDTGILTDAAYVDVTIDNTASATRAGWQMGASGTHNNVFIWNLNLTTNNVIGANVLTPTNWVFVDSTCSIAIGAHSGYSYLGSTTCD